VNSNLELRFPSGNINMGDYLSDVKLGESRIAVRPHSFTSVQIKQLSLNPNWSNAQNPVYASVVSSTASDAR